MLPPAPQRVHHDSGALRLGSYAGRFDTVDYTQFASLPLRLRREKRWLWLCVVREPWLLALAVVRMGYASSLFAFAQRRGEPGLRVDTSLLGGLGTRVERRDGRTAARWGERAPVHVVDDGGRWRIDAQLPGFELQATARTSQSLAVIADVAGGHGSATEKGAAFGNLQGEARVGGESLSLDGGLLGYDFTHGLLPRRTRWSWAFGLGHDRAGSPLALNLVQGFVGAAECALFRPDGITLLPEASRIAADGPRRWDVSAGPQASLRAEIAGEHHERRNLGLVRSRFLQATCSLHGNLQPTTGSALALDGMLGVVESQDVLW